MKTKTEIEKKALNNRQNWVLHSSYGIHLIYQDPLTKTHWVELVESGRDSFEMLREGETVENLMERLGLC